MVFIVQLLEGMRQRGELMPKFLYTVPTGALLLCVGMGWAGLSCRRLRLINRG